MARVGSEAGRYGGFQNHGHSGIADIIQPLSITNAQLSDANGSVTFTFPSIPVSQDWIFSCNIADAPSTAVFIAESVPTNLGSWTAGNNAGPFKCGANETLVVKGFALLPNLTYQCTITGEAVTSGKSSNVFPYPSTSTVVTQNQAGLKSVTLAITGAGTIGTGVYTANGTTQAFAYNASTGTAYQTFNTLQNPSQTTMIAPGINTGFVGGQVLNTGVYYPSIIRINTSTGAVIGTTLTSISASTGGTTVQGTYQWLISSDGSIAVYFQTGNAGQTNYWLYRVSTNSWIQSGAIILSSTIVSNMALCPGYPNQGWWISGITAVYESVILSTNSTTTYSTNTSYSTQVAFNATGTYFFTVDKIFPVTSGVPNFATTPVSVTGNNIGAYTSPPVSNSTGTLMYNLTSTSRTVNETTIPGGVVRTVGTFPATVVQIQIDASNTNIYGMTSGGQIYSMNISTGVVTTLASTTGNGQFTLSTSSGTGLTTPPTGYAYRILTVTAYGSSTGTIALSTDSSFTTSNFCVMSNNTTQLLNGRLINKPIYVTSSASGTTYVEIAYDLVFYDLTAV